MITGGDSYIFVQLLYHNLMMTMISALVYQIRRLFGYDS